MPSDLRDKPLVACLHPYIEERHEDIGKGLYPRHHLWGIDAVEKKEDWQVRLISTSNWSIPSILEKLLNRYLFRNSPGARAELEVWRISKSHDLIFSVCGPLALARHLKSVKLVSWVFRPPSTRVESALHPYNKQNLKSNRGFCCLTPKAEQYFSQFAPAKFIPWCVDLEMFDGKPPKNKPVAPFFLATGKTGRDYKTFLDGCIGVNAEVRIIGPSEFKPLNCPSNVRWIDSSQDPPDQAIDYPTLKEWYAQCSAVCIPLTGDTEDTCGYTNMLEAIAMRKPVLMTRSGCLHFNPESHGFGYLVAPKSPDDWAHKMNQILLDSEHTAALGVAGRKIAEKEFSIKRFNHDVIVFLREILERE